MFEYNLKIKNFIFLMLELCFLIKFTELLNKKQKSFNNK